MAVKNTTTPKIGQPSGVKPGSVLKDPSSTPPPPPVPRALRARQSANSSNVRSMTPAQSVDIEEEPEGPIVPPKQRVLGEPDPSDFYVAQPRQVRMRSGPNPNTVSMILIALVVVNGFTAKHFQNIFGVVSGSNTSPTTIHSDFLILGGEFVFVIALSMIAEANEGASGPILALALILWLVWGVHNASVLANYVKATVPPQPTSTGANPGTVSGSGIQHPQ